MLLAAACLLAAIAESAQVCVCVAHQANVERINALALQIEEKTGCEGFTIEKNDSYGSVVP